MLVSSVGMTMSFMMWKPAETNTLKLRAFDFAVVKFNWCVLLPNLRVKYLIILWNKEICS